MIISKHFVRRFLLACLMLSIAMFGGAALLSLLV